ncbi:alpha/beta hydrolase [Jidongwangia harbinensis]|uniref:alpha/beta hydrolase n=1 Tax=Jidongwangia harbinensis TaxID=2878561 RepID=UPI001CD96A3B|nr:alpha/beta hydrolase [Jidongwangia harbinensis]MCA2214276.1 alpha/beta hydrolase [Jidongwangia harbinensis]
MDVLRPLIVPVAVRDAERHGSIDLYPPDEVTGPRPTVLFVHGGPVPAELRPTPRDWPQYRAYGSLAAARGVVGATVDHRLHSPAAYPDAAADVRAAADAVRADPRVDDDRLALWFFSGSGMLAADWLRDPPPWLRCLTLSYPLLRPLPGWPADPRFLPADAVARAGDLPIVLTRVGQENPAIAEGVEGFVAASAGARLEIVEVPHGHHAFDVLDDDDGSRAALTRAVDLVLATLGR